MSEIPELKSQRPSCRDWWNTSDVNLALKAAGVFDRLITRTWQK